MSDVTFALLLADSDWQTVVAIVVFSLISIIANWVKKRSEASGPKPRTAGEDEFEPVELFDEPKPISRPTPVARPSTPPILIAARGRTVEPRGKPVSPSEHTSEVQVRITSKSSTPKVAMTPAMGGSAKGSVQHRLSESLQATEVEASPRKRLVIPDFRNSRTLRQTLVATELLRPPVALRRESELPGFPTQI